jgi:acetyl-CoA acetyltransferase
VVTTIKGQAAGLHRAKDGLGVWEHQGKVAILTSGYSNADRRWDENLENSLGAYSIIAAQKALDDAGISMDEVDGVISAPGPIGSRWDRPYFAPPYDSEDGLTIVTAEWLTKNMGLKNVKWVNSEESRGHAQVLCLAAQAIAEGLCNTALVIFPFGNLAGRYSQSGSAEGQDTAGGGAQWSSPWGWGAAGANFAFSFAQYCTKYNTSHDRMANFVVNLRRNGRMFPGGYYAQHPEAPLTVEDYLTSRWVVKPLCLHDADRPVNQVVAFLLTTAERAKDSKVKPVYIMNHQNNQYPTRGQVQTLEESEMFCENAASRMYEGTGWKASDVDIFNPYDGFTLFTQYYVDAFGWHGVKKGEAHDFYNGDISVEGPHPLLSSGGNNGSGRTRAAIFTDTFEQLQGLAGDRQVTIKNGRPETGIAGCTMPQSIGWLAFSTSPD